MDRPSRTRIYWSHGEGCRPEKSACHEGVHPGAPADAHVTFIRRGSNGRGTVTDSTGPVAPQLTPLLDDLKSTTSAATTPRRVWIPRWWRTGPTSGRR